MGYMISGHLQLGGVRMGSPPGLLRQEGATASHPIGVLPNIQVSLAYINVSGIVSIVSKYILLSNEGSVLCFISFVLRWDS